jgi:hypothetical protein
MERLEGLSLYEAQQKLKDKKYRILSIDNKPLIITCDYNPERLNLKIEDGVIVEVTRG